MRFETNFKKGEQIKIVSRWNETTIRITTYTVFSCGQKYLCVNDSANVMGGRFPLRYANEERASFKIVRANDVEREQMAIASVAATYGMSNFDLMYTTGEKA